MPCSPCLSWEARARAAVRQEEAPSAFSSKRDGGDTVRRMAHWRNGCGAVVAIACLSAAPSAGSNSGHTQAPSATKAPGYWLLGIDGGVFAFNPPFYGTAAQGYTCNGGPACYALPPTYFSGIAAYSDGSSYVISDATSM